MTAKDWWTRGYWIGVLVGIWAGLVLAASIIGCGPADKHYRSRGQAAHFPNCRAKCPATMSSQWHERRR